MTPKEYYYTYFQTDFARFFSSLKRKGSLSRRRGSLLRIFDLLKYLLLNLFNLVVVRYLLHRIDQK